VIRQFTVHAAKIPERFQQLTPDQRRALGVFYVNSCDEKKWIHAPDGSFEEPWTVVPCEACKMIVAHQPAAPRRSAARAPIRPRRSQ
jgi:hypothetical protein